MKSNLKFKIKYRFLIPLIIYIFDVIFNTSKKKIKSLSTKPFFIYGSGRNGSTLLASLLNCNENISIPPEQYVMPYAIMDWKLNKFQSYNKFINNILRSLSIKSKTSNWKFDINNVRQKLLNIPKKQQSLSFIFDCIYNNYDKSKNSIWGDKTPMNTHFSKYIFSVFPDANYIFLIRDPRDVVLSYSKMKNHPASKKSYAIWKWNDSIKSYDFLSKKNNVLIVKYENLVSDTENELERISKYLKVPIKFNSKFTFESLGVSEQKHHQNLKNPINISSIGKWKNELSENDVSFIVKYTKDNMERFGYKI
jgi:hypothetical protein